MGACGRAKADPEASAGDVNMSVQGDAKESDAEYLETQKQVLLMVLERRATAMDHDADNFQEIARVLDKENFLNLMNVEAWSKLLTECFEMKEPEEVDVGRNNLAYEQRKFVQLVRACETGQWKKSRKDVSSKVKAAAKK